MYPVLLTVVVPKLIVVLEHWTADLTVKRTSKPFMLKSGSDTDKPAPLPPAPEVPILTTTVPKPPTHEVFHYLIALLKL